MASYYKYRSLSDWKRFVDIIVCNRLYAAYYEDLNDPMEGLYKQTSKSKRLSSWLLKEMRTSRILSLTPDFIIGTPNSIKGPKVAVVHHES